MKLSILRRLLVAEDRSLPVVLVTRLQDGRQALLAEPGSSLFESSDSETEHWLPPATVVSAGHHALREDKSRIVEEDGVCYFLEARNPRKRLFVIGAVHIAQFLAPMATMAGYDVTLIDPRKAWGTAERFPGVQILHEWPESALRREAPDRRSAIVTLTHDAKLDDPALELAIQTQAFYVGALGSKRTHSRRLQRMKEKGVLAAEAARIHAPVGLDIGALSPAEIAVSILAELTLTLHSDTL